MPNLHNMEIAGEGGPRRYSKKVVIILGLLLIAFFILAITFIALYAVEVGKQPTTAPPAKPTDNPADSAAWRQAADRLKKAVNMSVNPCDDFYEFACGSWNQTSPMPEDRGRWGVFDILRRELSDKVHDLLKVNVEGPSESLNATQKMRKYFQACVNEADIERSENFQHLLNHISYVLPQFEHFPFDVERPDEIPTVSESIQALGRARKFGLRLNIFNNFIQSDNDRPRTNIIHFDSAPLGMDQRFYLQNGTELEAYRTYLTDIITHFGSESDASISASWVRDFVEDIIRFETALAQEKLTPEERRNVTATQNKMTLGEFASRYTGRIGLDANGLIQYFSEAWENPAAAALLTPQTTVNVRETRYYAALTSQSLWDGLFPVQHTARMFLANYIIYQVGNSYVDRLGAHFRNISLAFSSKLRGINATVPRWESCVNRISNEFPNAVGRLYVMENFHKSTKDRMTKMVAYLFDAIKDIISKSDWMTPDIRQKAIQKANSFTVLTGYEDYIVEDPARLNQEHSEFNTNSGLFLTMGFSMQRLSTKEEGTAFVNGTRKDSWITGAAVVNAFFAPNFASISFPAGILQPPFLGEEYPDYWNYGAVGTVIGHEITHGFDDKGSLYDGEGVLSYWWDDVSRRNFEARAEGLIQQYNNFSLMGIDMNGRLTQGENIADNGGMKEAFQGYRSFIAKEKNGAEEARLPGFENYSPNQLFFLANAQVWCSDFRLKELENQVRTGAHSPGRFRVIGPMQNYDEFAKAYSCPAGSYMNPAQKNGVW